MCDHDDTRLIERAREDGRRTRRIRFVCIDTGDPIDHALREAVGMNGPTIEDVVHGGERVDEEWCADTDDVEEDQTVPCLEVEWSIE